MEITNSENSPNPEVEKILNRYEGCLLGVAVGDALGAPAEFLSRREITRRYGVLSEMMGGGHFNWRKGQFTDDTDQTLAVVDSLIDNQKYEPEDVGNRFVNWYKSGPTDIGSTTSRSLFLLAKGGNWKDSGQFAGPSNGSLMRTAPIGLYFRDYPEEIDKAAAEVSAITHGHKDCLLACQIASHLVALLINGYSKNGAVEWLQSKYQSNTEASLKLQEVLVGTNPSLKEGNVLKTLSIALNVFLKSDSFEETIIKAVEEGGDTDTQATVAGAFAGAFWGADKIPQRWTSVLNPVSDKEIADKARKLYMLNKKLFKT